MMKTVGEEVTFECQTTIAECMSSRLAWQCGDYYTKYKIVSRTVYSSMAEYLPDIKILKILGEGRYGSIYLVKHSKWGKIVLKKLLNSTDKLDKRDLSVIQSETDVLKRVRGLNLVAFYDVQFDLGYCGLFLERVKYGSVDDFLKIYTVIQAWKMQIIFEIASAMSHLYEDLKMLHGNLKCQNILIGDDFRAKVSDFGLSRIHKIMSNPASGTPGPPREALGHIGSRVFPKAIQTKCTGIWRVFVCNCSVGDILAEIGIRILRWQFCNRFCSEKRKTGNSSQRRYNASNCETNYTKLLAKYTEIKTFLRPHQRFTEGTNFFDSSWDRCIVHDVEGASAGK